MPIYSVRSLDTVGNPVDGYEVNDTRNLGEVYVARLPERQLGYDYAFPFLTALITAEYLGDITRDDIRVEHSGDGDVEIQLLETAYAGTIGNEPRFIAMAPRSRSVREADRQRAAADAQLRTDEEMDFIDGFQPILSLEPQFISDSIRDEKNKIWQLAFPTEDDGLRLVEVGYDGESQRIGVTVLVLDAKNVERAVDEFEWPFLDWRQKPTFGFDPVDGEELKPTKKQLEEILVALDGALERHQ